jgi:hypothetical protein
MSSTKLSRALLGVACSIGLLATSAAGQTIDKKVYFTFSGPVEIPGATLPAGKYLFHLADPTSSRQVLQVQSADGKKVYGMFFSMAAERPTPSDDPEVRFMETAAGAPAAISTLWYAGERTGRELIYPRDQALRIAKNTNQSVLTTKASTTKADEAKSGDLSRVSPSGADTQVSASASAEPSGRLQRGDNDVSDTVAQTTPAARTPVATAGQEPVGRTTPARSRLPQTASNMPFMLMLAVGLFTATVALRLSRTGWM